MREIAPLPVTASAAMTPAPQASVADEQPDSSGTGVADYVPTSTTDKPSEEPTPQPVATSAPADYAHRYDTPPPEFVIPGEPIRSQASSPFDLRSGAFHGIRSVNGWSAIRVTVSIPCGSSRFSTRAGYNEVTGSQGQIDAETGYVYMGGWGAGPRGAPVDAGLQKSSAQAARDAYAVYWKFGRNHPKTLDVRYPCDGPDVALELYPVTNRLLVFSAAGIDQRGVLRTQTIVQRMLPEDGWVPSGGSASDGIILKRIISIAQPSSWNAPGHNDRWRNGSYFGLRSDVDRTPTVIWRSCEIGRVVPPAIVPVYQRWTPAQTWQPRGPNVYADWPQHAIAVAPPPGACDAAGIALTS
jgi:hypothetical protein